MNDIRNRLPLIFAIAFVAVILWLTWHKLSAWQGVMQIGGMAFVGSYILWLFLESRVALTESAKGETRADRGTCEAYALGRALTVVCALAFPAWWSEPGPWMLAGFGVFISGVAFRLIAIRTLGKFYSHRVRVMGDHQVVSSGPYQLVRHPAYTGMLTAHVGVVIFFFNVYTLAALLLILLPSMVMRIRVEETALFELPGYPEYAVAHRRLLPLVW
ncbi:isoprenylcysteine carboxylmethyltransferase family protein [Chitinivorax sp. PXF-14]|uniref:methyltransferase family protein n=1 Tax=Chitinivorax sp. PXF-14 TaxID=3230488 RepID=UPI0034665584